MRILAFNCILKLTNLNTNLIIKYQRIMLLEALSLVLMTKNV